jgi:hypothetical protein
VPKFLFISTQPLFSSQEDVLQGLLVVQTLHSHALLLQVQYSPEIQSEFPSSQIVSSSPKTFKEIIKTINNKIILNKINLFII